MDKVTELAREAGFGNIVGATQINGFQKFYALARADLEADLAATRDLAEGYAQERNELKAENAKLQKANKMLDTALCRAYPYGCYNGDVAYLWNAARASLGDK